jgi:hypothetical protein
VEELEIINPVVMGAAVAAGTFFGILVALWLGRHIGTRVLARHGSIGHTGVTSLETAVFALLGLMIAFTFSGALNRFDGRRAQAVDEANAIGTAWLRIDLLPSAAQPKLRESFKSYVDARIATYSKLPNIKAARAEVARSHELQSVIWAQAVTALRSPQVRLGTDLLVLPPLNSMFDISTVRLTATQIHPPLAIYVMLIGLALASALLAGYQTAGEKAYDWVHQVGFATIVALTVYIILDIEYPRMGLIRIDAIDHLLVDVRAGMK